MSHVEQEQLTCQEHSRSPLVFSGVHVAQFLVFCVVFCRSFFLLAFYCLVLWFTTFDYPFGIFKLFFLIPWQILPLWLKFQIFYDLVYNQLKCKWFKRQIKRFKRLIKIFRYTGHVYYCNILKVSPSLMPYYFKTTAFYL